MHFLQDITAWRGKMRNMESKMLIQKVVSKNLKGLRNTTKTQKPPLAKNKGFLISQHQVLGATCVGLAVKHLGIELMEFDVTIIDETGRATAPEILIPALRTKN